MNCATLSQISGGIAGTMVERRKGMFRHMT